MKLDIYQLKKTVSFYKKFGKQKSKVPPLFFKRTFSWSFSSSISSRSLRKSDTFTTVNESWRRWKNSVGGHRLFRCFRNQHLGSFIITDRPVFNQWRSVARKVVVGYSLLREIGRTTEFPVNSIHSPIKIHRFFLLSFVLEVWSNLFSRELEGCKMSPYYKRLDCNIIHYLQLVGRLKILVRLIRGKNYVGIYTHRRRIRQIVF